MVLVERFDKHKQASVILATIPSAFVGGIVASLIAGENVERLFAGRPDRPVRDYGAKQPRA